MLIPACAVLSVWKIEDLIGFLCLFFGVLGTENRQNWREAGNGFMNNFQWSHIISYLFMLFDDGGC